MQSSDNMTAPTRASQGAFTNGLPEKRGIRFNPHVTVQGDPAAQWDIANGMKKLSLDDGGAAKDHARAASSDSSADSAPIVTPVPGKEANDIHVGSTKKPPTSTFTPGAHFQVAGGPASQTRPANLPPGYPYRGPNAPVTLGGRDEILQVDYNLQPRHFIPSSIASSPAASVHSQPQARATGANATSPPAVGTAPFTPGLSMTNPTAFYGQPSAYNGAAGAAGAPSVDPAAANEVAQRIINNALQQAALITGNAAGVPLNPALAATYTNPQFMAGLYNPTMYGQAPSANPYYSAGPGMPDPAMAAALANAVATLPPAAFHAALQGFAGYGVPGATNPANPSTVGGPSANNRKLGLYKSELCRSWSETGSCRYGPKCQFAHGEDELRKVARHPKYKTEICRTFWVSGSCPYGKRCCFIHTEVPGGAGAKDGEAPTPTAAAAAAEGRARSHSTNSDPDQQTSMLARIKRQEPSGGATGSSTPPTSATGPATPGSATFARPSPAALRVDTSSLDSPNHTKESYPYTSNAAIPAPGVPILRTDLSGGRRSPAPATAGPDFGRHNTAARLEVVGNNPMPQTRTGPGHLRSVSQTFQPTDQSSGRASPVVANGHLRSDSWSAASALVAPSSAIDPPARYRESKW